MSDVIPRKPYYVEKVTFSGKFVPQIWYAETQPSDKSSKLRNVHELDEHQAAWPLAALHEMFNPQKVE